MPRLADLLTPASTAVLTVEMQRGVIGDQVRPGMTALPEAASRAGTVAAAARVARAARAVGVRVIHATISLRADRAGVSINNRMMAVLSRDTEQMREGTAAVEIIPELEVAASDIVMNRVHGLTPFGGTELDAVLRNLGVRTIVPVGVSVNVAILGSCLAAADLGYQLVLATDAVVGIPESYAAEVINNTLALLATLTTADEVVAAWA